MRKSGGQVFLNPPDSEDSGFVTWFIKPDTKRNEIESGITIADCSRRVTLDFDVNTYNMPGITEKQKYLSSISIRRKKIALLRKVINSYCDNLLQVLDEIEAIIKVDSKLNKVKK